MAKEQIHTVHFKLSRNIYASIKSDNQTVEVNDLSLAHKISQDESLMDSEKLARSRVCTFVYGYIPTNVYTHVTNMPTTTE